MAWNEPEKQFFCRKMASAETKTKGEVRSALARLTAMTHKSRWQRELGCLFVRTHKKQGQRQIRCHSDRHEGAGGDGLRRVLSLRGGKRRGGGWNMVQNRGIYTACCASIQPSILTDRCICADTLECVKLQSKHTYIPLWWQGHTAEDTHLNWGDRCVYHYSPHTVGGNTTCVYTCQRQTKGQNKL